jgi:hypothetical protein
LRGIADNGVRGIREWEYGETSARDTTASSSPEEELALMKCSKASSEIDSGNSKVAPINRETASANLEALG